MHAYQKRHARYSTVRTTTTSSPSTPPHPSTSSPHTHTHVVGRDTVQTRVTDSRVCSATVSQTCLAPEAGLQVSFGPLRVSLRAPSVLNENGTDTFSGTLHVCFSGHHFSTALKKLPFQALRDTEMDNSTVLLELGLCESIIGPVLGMVDTSTAGIAPRDVSCSSLSPSSLPASSSEKSQGANGPTAFQSSMMDCRVGRQLDKSVQCTLHELQWWFTSLQRQRFVFRTSAYMEHLMYCRRVEE